MTEEQEKEAVESLGEYLQRLRKEKNLSFEEVLRETRIPPKSLQAMEENDYESLPADAFARGFYMLLARCLDLDSAAVLERYDSERSNAPTEEKLTPPSSKLATNLLDWIVSVQRFKRRTANLNWRLLCFML